MPRLQARRAAQVALETLELHLPRSDGGDAFDLTFSRVHPRRDHGQPFLDIALLHERGGELVARATRVPAPPSGDLKLIGTIGDWRRTFELEGHGIATIDLSTHLIAQRNGVALTRSRGELIAFDRRIPFDGPLLINERRAARRPYAWARASLFGQVEGERLVCLLETSRGRAGSVALPALGRIRLFGPGARHLPKGCVLSPLPARAEYGTGRLRAAALAPAHRVELELDTPDAATALFEVVDPNGDAAYAHRALGAIAQLRLRGRRGSLIEVALVGRYEWGARAGDPRVEQRAWRA